MAEVFGGVRIWRSAICVQLAHNAPKAGLDAPCGFACCRGELPVLLNLALFR
jgi:hypothetical protein